MERKGVKRRAAEKNLRKKETRAMEWDMREIRGEGRCKAKRLRKKKCKETRARRRKSTR